MDSGFFLVGRFRYPAAANGRMALRSCDIARIRSPALRRIRIEGIAEYAPGFLRSESIWPNHGSEKRMLHYLINGRLLADPDRETIGLEAGSADYGLNHLET